MHRGLRPTRTDEVEKRFRALRWHNAPNYEAWRKDIESVRRKGYSIDRVATISAVW